MKVGTKVRKAMIETYSNLDEGRNKVRQIIKYKGRDKIPRKRLKGFKSNTDV